MREPIVAKPVGPLVRLQRWAQRNPALAGAVGGIFALLAAGLGIALFLLGQRDRALAEVTTERNERQAALAEKSAALDDYDRLGDLSRLGRLAAEADGLWPAEPGKVTAMTAWVERASKLEERLGRHRSTLDRLRQHGDSRPSGWEFESAADQFKHDTTAKLVESLGAFADPDPRKGLLADVRRRLRFAESVEHETLTGHAKAWEAAIKSISDPAECPKYRGLRIAPQLGLIPIARDPASGLWEFAHLQTAASTPDAIPKRDAAGRLVVTEATGLVFVLVPGDAFRMGAVKPDEGRTPSDPNVDADATAGESPVTEIALDPFFVSKYEMTQAQWLRLTGKNPSAYAPDQVSGGKAIELRNPVEQVSWEDCQAWLPRLSLALPTEAQWEYAARGGTTTPRWTGLGTEELAKAANLADAFCRDNGGPSSWNYEPWNDGFAAHAPVGSFAPNPFGLHDVLGNVWEWCEDRHGPYSIAPRRGDGLRSPEDAAHCVHRGGAFNDTATLARSAARGAFSPDTRIPLIGVRPVRRVVR
jgi:formylglycine-generating enzyme required for sulfatase activity